MRDESKQVRPTWTPELIARVKPELAQVPPCAECGRVPEQYARFEDGSVQCIGTSLAACLARPLAIPVDTH